MVEALAPESVSASVAVTAERWAAVAERSSEAGQVLGDAVAVVAEAACLRFVQHTGTPSVEAHCDGPCRPADMGGVSKGVS